MSTRQMEFAGVEQVLGRDRANTTTNMFDLPIFRDIVQKNRVNMIMQRRRKTNYNVDQSQFESYDYNIWGVDASEDEDGEFEELGEGENPRVSWKGIELNPNFRQIFSDKPLFISKYNRRLHLGPPPSESEEFRRLMTFREFREMVEKMPKNEFLRKNTVQKKTRRTSKKPSIWDLDIKIDADLNEFMHRRQFEVFEISLEKTRPIQPRKDLRKTKQIVGFDEYFGLTDWSTFHGRNLRPENFAYSKMYPGMGQLMVNTTNNIMGLKLDVRWKNLSNFRLYQNDQMQQIEEFACNSVLRYSDEVRTLAIKHSNQEMVYLFDCNRQEYRQKIKLENTKKNLLESEFTQKKSTFRKNSTFKEPFNKGKRGSWLDLQRRRTKVYRQKLGDHEAISEMDSENSCESYMQRGILLTGVDRVLAPQARVTQYLEYHENIIYYLDNSFKFVMFDERQNQNVVVENLRNGDNRFGNK